MTSNKSKEGAGMRSAKYLGAVLLLPLVFACCPHRANAREPGGNIIVANGLDADIVGIRFLFPTPYGEPYIASLQDVLIPLDRSRIGTEEVTLPEQAIVDLVTERFIFPDLSTLRKSNRVLYLDMILVDGVPLLQRTDGNGSPEKGAARGARQRLLTPENRPNAVDRSLLAKTATLAEVATLVRKTTEAVREKPGVVRHLEVEAGPIRDNDHALARCPEALAEWNTANKDAARWTGQWVTTVPETMSVCKAVTRPASLDETLFKEGAGWGNSLSFPVVWKGLAGTARVAPEKEDAPEGKIVTLLRLPLPAESGMAMLDPRLVGSLGPLLADLLDEGYRPLRLQTKTDLGEVKTVSFLETAGDAKAHLEVVRSTLALPDTEAALAWAEMVWVRGEAFAALASGKEPPAAPAVRIRLVREVFEALFLPDGRHRIAFNEPNSVYFQ
jgi:hypothetical protein